MYNFSNVYHILPISVPSSLRTFLCAISNGNIALKKPLIRFRLTRLDRPTLSSLFSADVSRVLEVSVARNVSLLK